ncbi:hypothetical protein AQUCO_08200031v1 [Aquilegia coerulea]|uniref:Hpc2-related domain-containing protein n=1 Tax=Aquilegia coerulea TaxID=218851 RepID=A0A2G5C7G9_AQUCA|nr:hypothetical protein AQUCO_08200031v1 [Aquilegia coerulea]
MAEEKNETGGGGGGDIRVSTSSLFPTATTASSRQRFSIELKPDETTIVSWKKLIKESSSSNKSNKLQPIVAEPPSGAHPALESRIAPQSQGQPAECEEKEAPPTNRFNAVIEKIERLYVGNENSDEEELANVPDDDQYDTEDSFIDDADLDEYFEVDKSTTKHKGFFVNRGKLERINEHSSSPKDQPKKRRRKDLSTHFEKDGDDLPNKHAKMSNARMKAVARTAPLVGNKSSSPPQSLVGKSEHYQDDKSFNKLNAPVGAPKKRSSDPNINLEQSVSSEIHRDQLESKDSEKQKIGVTQSRDLGSKLKIAAELSEATNHIYQDKNYSQIDPQSRRLLNDAKESEQATKIRQREKSTSCELSNPNSSRSKNNMQTTKSPSTNLKDGSSVRPKGTMLERAIRDLEDIVKESRPPTMEIHDADGSSQGIKRRLPREVKQKLAKVARLAQSSQGKISDELINRLMGILGHILQRRTLKRNMREMVALGLSAKQEKDAKFQQIKKEIVEMIRVRGTSLKSKVSGQPDGACDDFEEVRSSDEKGFLKVKGGMDNAMEDKICDLYDLYVEGMDEDKSSQVRKLYVELAELWPNGIMDNHGIKNAVCRSKARKRATHSRIKNLEKVKQQNHSSTTRMEDSSRGESNPIAQPRPVQDRVSTESSGQLLNSPNRIMGNVTTANHQSIAYGKTSLPAANGSSLNRPKQEKIKGSSVTFLDEVRKTTDQALLKKKVKRKPESDLHYHPEKLPSQEGKERHKPNKQDSNHNKSDLQLAGFPGCEQLS